MLKILAILAVLSLSAPAYSAGLGFNPFERNSPTSATGSAKPSPAAPASSVAPAPKPAPTPVLIPKQDAQPQKPQQTQNKK
jgi:hypothetical protein